MEELIRRSDAIDALKNALCELGGDEWGDGELGVHADDIDAVINDIPSIEPSIDIVRCKECKKSHIDGKTTHYLWCVEWGRSTDTFGYCERGEREGE